AADVIAKRQRPDRRVDLPLAQPLVQFRCQPVQLHAADHWLAEHLRGGFVGQPYFVVLADHHDAGAHALDDQLVELLHARQAGSVLLGQVLGMPQTAAQALNEQRHGKVDAAEYTDLQIALADGGVGQAEKERQIDQRQTGQRSQQLADASVQQDIAGRHGNDQQVAQAAGSSAGGVEQYRQQEDIQRCQHEQVYVPLAPVQQQRDDHVDDQVDPADAFVQLRIAQVDEAVV